MIQNEAIYRLKRLPKDATLTAEHVLAVIDWVEKSAQSASATSPTGPPKLIDEKELSDWLGEAVSTIQKWRVSGTGPKFIKKPKNVAYRVKDVEDWLDSHTVSSTSEATMKGLAFTTLLPVFHHTINGELQQLSLQESLETGESPEGYEILEADGGEAEPDEVAFMQALGTDNDQARAVLSSQPHARVNVAFWFFRHCLNEGFCRGDRAKLFDAVSLLASQGIPMADTFRFKGDEFSLGHVLADCHGHTFTVDFMRCQQTYQELMVNLLDAGMDVTAPGRSRLTPMEMADQTEAVEGIGTSMFKRTYGSWKLNRDLSASLQGEAVKPKKQAI